MAENTHDEGYYWAEKVKENTMKQSLKKMKQSEGQLKSGQSNLLNFISKEASKSKEPEEIINSDITSIKKVEGAERFEIICDNRETASPVARTLSLMGLNLRLERLPVADYVISERTGIERKSSKDFSDSIKDGRLFNEILELRNNFERAILILEGDPFQDSNISESALYGAIASIILNLGVTIYKTKDPKETATFLYQLAKKEQTDSKGVINIKFEKAPIDTSRLLEYIVAGIPGVNSLRAKNLLKELKTLQNIFSSEISDLTKVENIGKKIAQEIYKLGRYKYHESS